MKQVALSYFTDIHLTILGLLIFFTWFVVMCIWVMKIFPAAQVTAMSLLPLNDELSGEVTNE